MQNINITNEEILTFLSNTQGITKRAIRLNEEQNQDKFEREAMGALMQSAGYRFGELLTLMDIYPKIFDFETNIDKLKVMDSLSDVLGNRYSHLEIQDMNYYKTLIGFLTNYFSNYTNEYDGKLSFYCKEAIKKGMKIGVQLICESVDLMSCTDNPTNFARIDLYGSSNGTFIGLKEVIAKIKDSLPEYREVEKSKITHDIKQVITISNNRDCCVDSIGKNEVYIDTAKLYFEDRLVIAPIRYINSILHSDSYFYIDGLEYSAIEGVEDLDELNSLYDYFINVAIKMGIIENLIIQVNIEKIEKLKAKVIKLGKKFKNNKEEYIYSCYFGYIMNMQVAIYENISIGLSKSLENASNNLDIYRPFWNTIRKSMLSKKWERNDENTYSRITQN